MTQETSCELTCSQEIKLEVMKRGLRAKLDQVPAASAALKEASLLELSKYFGWDMVMDRVAEDFRNFFRPNTETPLPNTFCILSELPIDVLGVRHEPFLLLSRSLCFLDSRHFISFAK